MPAHTPLHTSMRLFVVSAWCIHFWTCASHMCVYFWQCWQCDTHDGVVCNSQISEARTRHVMNKTDEPRMRAGRVKIASMHFHDILLLQIRIAIACALMPFGSHNMRAAVILHIKIHMLRASHCPQCILTVLFSWCVLLCFVFCDRFRVMYLGFDFWNRDHIIYCVSCFVLVFDFWNQNLKKKQKQKYEKKRKRYKIKNKITKKNKKL